MLSSPDGVDASLSPRYIEGITQHLSCHGQSLQSAHLDKNLLVCCGDCLLPLCSSELLHAAYVIQLRETSFKPNGKLRWTTTILSFSISQWLWHWTWAVLVWWWALGRDVIVPGQCARGSSLEIMSVYANCYFLYLHSLRPYQRQYHCG